MASSKRRKYLEDVKQREDGTLEYTGRTYRIGGDAGRARIRLAAGALVIGALIIFSGCIDAAGANNAFYVIIPYIGEVSCLFVLCWNLVRTLAGRDAVREYVLEQARERIPAVCKIMVAFAGLGFLFSVWYLIRNGFGESTAKSVTYPLCKALTTSLAAWYDGTFRRTEWVKN